jgi:tetratricopeptide (TPR) repeat protein
VYGPDHPNVAIDFNNLGNVLWDHGRRQGDLGKLQEARKLYERALKIFRTRLGDDHPQTKIVRRNLEYLDSLRE